MGRRKIKRIAVIGTLETRLLCTEYVRLRAPCVYTAIETLKVSELIPCVARTHTHVYFHADPSMH